MTRPRSYRARWTLLCALALLSACGTPESRKAKYLARGRAYAAQGNWEKARVEFKNALQAMPNDAEVRYENGVAAEKLSNLRDAVGLYQGALESNPDYVDARYHLARAFLLGGAADRALEVLKPGLEKHPDEPQFLTVRAAARGRLQDPAGALADAERAYQLAPKAEDTVAVLAGLYAAQGRRDDAIRVLEAGIAAVPATIDLRSALVQSYLLVDRRDDAVRVLNDLIRLQPDQAAHPMHLAALYAAIGRLPEAEATLRKASAAIPKSLPIKLAIVQLIGQRDGLTAAAKEFQAQVDANPKLTELQFAQAQFYADTRQPEKAEATLNGIIKAEGRGQSGIAAKDALAMLKLRTGDVAAAEALVAEVLKSNPRDVQALSVRADIDMARNDPKSAVADLRAVMRDQPNSIPVLRALAKAHFANGEAPQAEEVLRRAIDANPGDASVRLELVDLLSRTGRTDAALAAAEEASKAAATNAAVVEALFRVELLRRDYPAAAATAQRAKTQFPDLALGDYLAGLVAEAQGNAAAALGAYGSAVDRNPGAEDALAALARLSVREKKTAALADRLTRITAGNPKLVQPWQLRGELELGDHRYADAEQSFRKAIELTPQRLASYRGIAMARAAAGDSDGAIAALKEAQAHVSNPDEAAFELADGYRQFGHPDEAAKTYEALLARNPANEVAANNLAMLLSSRTDAASLDRAKALSTPLKSSSNPRFVDTYGWVLIARKEYPQAIAVLGPLVDKAPDVPTFRYHLALAQVRSGDVAGGRTNLQRALKGGNQFEGGVDAKALLDGLPAG